MEVVTKVMMCSAAGRRFWSLLASTVDLAEAPDILALIKEYGADSERFVDGEKRRRRFMMTIPFTCVITTSASTAGAVSRSARMMPSMLLR